MYSHVWSKKTGLEISECQKRFLLEWALDPSGSAYNISMVYKIQGKLDRVALKQACNFFTRKHQIVHALFSENGSKLFYGKFTIDDFYKELILPDQLDEIQFIQDVLDKPYNLATGPLFNHFLFSNKFGRHYFFIKAQHVIADAVSMGVWVEEIASYYNAIVEKKSFNNESLSIIEPSIFEQSSVNAVHQNESSIFWANYLKELPLKVSFPVKSGDLKDSLASESFYFSFSEIETAAFKQFAKENKTTLFVVLAALYGV